ncbi:hypothetical protein Tco_0986022 [Tanacetum coccineum]
MSTPVFVDPEISTQADGAQSSLVPAPFPKDLYEAIRQACLVETDTESEPFVDPIKTETIESPYIVASPTSLPDSTPPVCHAEESEESDTSGVRSMSSDSTVPLSPDYPLTYTSPTPTPIQASFHRRTARMTVRALPAMSPSHLARVTKAMALLDSAFRKRYRSSYETPSSSSSPALPVRKRYRGTSELILDTDSEGDELGDEDIREDESLDADEERERELEVEEDQVYSAFEVGQSYGSIPEPERSERVLTLRQLTLTTWIDLEDGTTYIDVPVYPPPTPPVQTSLSPKWSFGSLFVSPAPFVLGCKSNSDTFYNALNSNDQDSLNSAAGGNFLDKMPRDCLRIIESKSKVCNSCNKPVVAKVSASNSTPGISPDVAELKDMVKALLLDKKNQSQALAPVKTVEESCVTCSGAYSYRNCPATDGNVYHDNIQEYVSQAAVANFNQGNTD